MQKYIKTPVARLRAIGILEGISFLVLLGIAMPLKYVAGIPEAVKVTGWLHGLLFVLYIAAIIQAALVMRWSLLKTFIAFVASVVPFGTFILDSRLRREEALAAQAK